MKIIFMTFGGPTVNYYDAVERLCKQAEGFCIFNEIIGYTDKDLKNDVEFWNLHGEFIEKSPRGYGYYIWKPYLILKTLNSMQEGDILLYLDCGCELNINGKEKFLQHIEKVKEKLILGTTGGSCDVKFTKNDLIEYCGMVNHPKLSANHMQAGIILAKKCDIIVNLYKEFYDIASNNHNLIDNSPSKTPNNISFIEHRHDQSIFNILVKKYDLLNYDMDRTFYGAYPNYIDVYNIEARDNPIWALRNRTGNCSVK